MNYIWDILLKADRQDIKRENIKFVPAKVFSPYIEVLLSDLNIRKLPESNTIEVNPYYRFHEIFKDLLDVNLEESPQLREVIFDIITHFLAELDLKEGLCKQEFYKKFIKDEIKQGIFGNGISEAVDEFSKEELDYILSGLITLYLTGTSLHLFNKIMKKVFPNTITYQNKDNPKKVLIYLGEFRTQELKRKIEFILDLFLPINMKSNIYYEYHFGIIGVDETMKMENMVIN
ncbi:MAG: hypothetical protein AB6733_24385 [Clostridiaceae bacterium]